MVSQMSAHRGYLQVAVVAALVFIVAALVVLSVSPAGILGMLTYNLLPIAWLTACCSIAGLALASIRY